MHYYQIALGFRPFPSGIESSLVIPPEKVQAPHYEEVVVIKNNYLYSIKWSTAGEPVEANLHRIVLKGNFGLGIAEGRKTLFNQTSFCNEALDEETLDEEIDTAIKNKPKAAFVDHSLLVGSTFTGHSHVETLSDEEQEADKGWKKERKSTYGNDWQFLTLVLVLFLDAILSSHLICGWIRWPRFIKPKNISQENNLNKT